MNSNLEDHSDLWTSGEWGLNCSYHSQDKVVVRFKTGVASTAELVAIRRLMPEFANAPVSLLKGTVQGQKEIVLAETSSMAARRLANLARSAGLEVDLVGESWTSYSIVRIDGSAALVIDDDVLFDGVVQMMLQHGVPIVGRVECD